MSQKLKKSHKQYFNFKSYSKNLKIIQKKIIKKSMQKI